MQLTISCNLSLARAAKDDHKTNVNFPSQSLASLSYNSGFVLLTWGPRPGIAIVNGKVSLVLHI
jgi:hypothetical protein